MFFNKKIGGIKNVDIKYYALRTYRNLNRFLSQIKKDYSSAFEWDYDLYEFFLDFENLSKKNKKRATDLFTETLIDKYKKSRYTSKENFSDANPTVFFRILLDDCIERWTKQKIKSISRVCNEKVEYFNVHKAEHIFFVILEDKWFNLKEFHVIINESPEKIEVNFGGFKCDEQITKEISFFLWISKFLGKIQSKDIQKTI